MWLYHAATEPLEGYRNTDFHPDLPSADWEIQQLPLLFQVSVMSWWLERSNGVGTTDTTAVTLILQHKFICGLSSEHLSCKQSGWSMHQRRVCFSSENFVFSHSLSQSHLYETEVKWICIILFHWNSKYLVLELGGILKRELAFFPRRAKELWSLLLYWSVACIIVRWLCLSGFWPHLLLWLAI